MSMLNSVSEMLTEVWENDTAVFVCLVISFVLFRILWDKGLNGIIGLFFALGTAFIWLVIIGTFWLYLDGYLNVGFSWSCGTILLLIAIIMPLAPFININFHYLTMIEEKGLKYSVKNWKLPLILGIEQSKRWYVDVVYEGEADPEVRKSRAEDAKKAAEEKAAEEKRQEERDRRFLLGEEE
jgi:hypothetical protein